MNLQFLSSSTLLLSPFSHSNFNRCRRYGSRMVWKRHDSQCMGCMGTVWRIKYGMHGFYAPSDFPYMHGRCMGSMAPCTHTPANLLMGVVHATPRYAMAHSMGRIVCRRCSGFVRYSGFALANTNNLAIIADANKKEKKETHRRPQNL